MICCAAAGATPGQQGKVTIVFYFLVLENATGLSCGFVYLPLSRDYTTVGLHP